MALRIKLDSPYDNVYALFIGGFAAPATHGSGSSATWHTVAPSAIITAELPAGNYDGSWKRGDWTVPDDADPEYGIFENFDWDGSAEVVDGGSGGGDGSGGAASTVDNTKIVQARVRKLGTRFDGVASAYPDIKPKLGEVLPWWVDPSDIAGDDWPESVSDVATTDASAVAITMNDDEAKAGVITYLGVVWLTPVWATGHNTAEITFNLNYSGGRVIPVSMTANKPTR